jgi:drug/metabolite transporter (DMT)-like permease
VAYLNISTSTLRKGTAVSVLSSASYAGMVVFLRYAYQAGILPGTAVFLRFAVASAALILILTLTRRWINLPRRQIISLLLLGFAAYTLLGTTWFVALNTTPAWLVSLIVALYPLTVNLGSWLFLKEPIRYPQITALGATLLGAVVLFWRPFEGANWLGVTLMLVNVAVNTTYILVGQRWTRGIPPMMSTAWMMVGATVGTFGYALLSHQLSFSFAPVGWLWAASFAVISTALAISAFWWSVALMGAARAAIVGSLEPLGAIMLSVLVLGERLTALQIVGGALILAGVLLVQWQPAAVAAQSATRFDFRAASILSPSKDAALHESHPSTSSGYSDAASQDADPVL